jgi:peptidoglycan/xylan/chitin deacetylase (PgdA/CDA1 family)
VFDLTLSFDNGPEPDVTPLVLDTLARRAIHASFFVIGAKLATPAGRRLAERAKAEGHWIGNHTWSHDVPLGRLEEEISLDEIARTQAELGPLAEPQRLFRPFGGGGKLGPHLLSQAVVDHLAAERFTVVLWNAIPRDWDDADGWVDRALAQCKAQPWTLMVLHDLPSGAMRHLDRFLDAVEEAGGRLRQEFPPDCVPMIEGRVVRPIEDYVASE